jgi:hypothetical protein
MGAEIKMPQGRFHTDKSGNRFGMLTLVTMLDEKSGNGSYRYITQCDCGESKAIYYNQMARGSTKSCGCQQYPKGKLSASWKHGKSRTKEYESNYQMTKNYGIGLKEYDVMFNTQNGVCAICSKEPPNHYKKRLNVDHCHTTGKVRGLLCDACNRAIGLLKDSQELLEKAKQYLKGELN